jgi:DNA repair photolyase
MISTLYLSVLSMSDIFSNAALKFIRPVRKGRGANHNPANRFDLLSLEPDFELEQLDCSPIKTQYYKDTSRSLITYNKSPDIPFEASINPYRGCEHGCIYCYARPTHEYFGLSSGLDFESKIFVKQDAAKFLQEELSKKSWVPKALAMSGVTDPYQPIEKKLQITRQCLKVLLDFRNPVSLITKNHLITRDLDILEEMAQYQLCSVCISLTTLDSALARIMEPRTSAPVDCLKAVEKLAKKGVHVGVLTAPIIPALNDHEIPELLKKAKEAGAQFAGYTILRLPYTLTTLFEQWLTNHFSDRKEKVLNRLRTMRGGKLYNAEWGKRMSGEGVFAEQINQLFRVAYKKVGFSSKGFELSVDRFRNPHEKQLTFFR